MNPVHALKNNAMYMWNEFSWYADFQLFTKFDPCNPVKPGTCSYMDSFLLLDENSPKTTERIEINTKIINNCPVFCACLLPNKLSTIKIARITKEKNLMLKAGGPKWK